MKRAGLDSGYAALAQSPVLILGAPAYKVRCLHRAIGVLPTVLRVLPRRRFIHRSIESDSEKRLGCGHPKSRRVLRCG